MGAGVTTAILLSTLRDPVAFLGPAPLPLVDLDPAHPNDRWTWTGVCAVRVLGEGSPDYGVDLHDAASLYSLGLGLDPDDLTTAAHLDLQVARHWSATHHPEQTVLWAGLEVDDARMAALRMLVTAYGAVPSVVRRAVVLPHTITDTLAARVYLVSLYFGVKS